MAEGPDADDDAELVELDAERPIAGGEVLARDARGAVVLVRGALAGERVRAVATGVRQSVRRAEVRSVDDVLVASPDRREPVCPHVADGCGGCDLQHLAVEAQPVAKRLVVLDALRRLARVDAVDVDAGVTLGGRHRRTTVRAAVVDGRAGFRMARSHRVVVPRRCPAAHQSVEEVLVEGRFAGAGEVVIRAGVATGERLVLADGEGPDGEGPDVEAPDGVVVVTSRAARAGASGAAFHEVVAGRLWRVSAPSFFQSGPVGAAELVRTVQDLAVDVLRPGGRVIDLYGGVGLLAGALVGADGPAPGGAAWVVERSRSAVDDARANLADIDARVVRAEVEAFRPPKGFRPDLVVADPARQGLGRGGVDAVRRCGADAVVLVSCDPASFGRDTRLLAADGFELRSARLVDLFPHTHHLEVVGRFDRS